MTTPVTRLVVVLLALVGCAGGESDSDPETGAATFSCGGAIDLFDELPDEFEIHGGVMAVMSSERHQRGRTMVDDDGVTWAFSKIALAVRHVQEFTLVSADTSSLLLDWGLDGESVGRVSVDGCAARCDVAQPGCAAGEQARWAIHPGGVWSSAAGCAELELLVDGRSEMVRLPLGAECDERAEDALGPSWTFVEAVDLARDAGAVPSPIDLGVGCVDYRYVDAYSDFPVGDVAPGAELPPNDSVVLVLMSVDSTVEWAHVRPHGRGQESTGPYDCSEPMDRIFWSGE